MPEPDFIIIGAGTVGISVAYGLLKRGHRVTVLDGGRGDFRAARANFGLVWVQGKGANLPPYARWSRRSIALWPDFRDALEELTGMPVDYRNPGGLVYCLSDEGMDERQRILDATDQTPGETTLLDRTELEKLVPGVPYGPDVRGASFGPTDGHCNPLKLLGSLQQAVLKLGGEIRWSWPVRGISTHGGGYRVEGPEGESLHAPSVIVAAGLATPGLVAPFGLDLPLRAQRGQILVTERMERLLPFPCSGLRQTEEGTIMIGATHEDVGLDTATTQASGQWLAARATRILPALANARLVRQWAGLRVLSRDGGPIYGCTSDFPGLWSVSCHSGVTLAAAHADDLAVQISAGRLTGETEHFSKDRFHVQIPA